MPRVKSKRNKKFRVSAVQYFCVDYLATVTERTAKEIVTEAIKMALRYINEEQDNPRRPKVPKKPKVIQFALDREVEIAMSMLNIEKHLDWRETDIVRYGLSKSLSSYAERYPVLKTISSKYKDYDNETE